MTEEYKPLLRIDLGANGGEFEFSSMEEIQDFIRTEIDFWSFLGDVEGMQIPEEFKAFARGLNRKLQRFPLQIGSFERKETQASDLEQGFRNLFYVSPEAVSGSDKLPLSRTPKARYMVDAFTRQGPVAGIAALSVEASSAITTSFIQNPIALRGILSYINFLNGNSPTEPDAIRSAIEVNAKEYRKKFESDSSEFVALKQKSHALLDRGERLRILAAKWVRHRWERRSAAMQVELDKHIASFQQTEETYKTFMKLKAPAKYWEEKASGHDTRTKIFGYISACWALVAGVAVFLFVSSLFDQAVALSKQETSNGTLIPLNAGVLFILGAQALIVSTIVFWIARVLVRLFLSELHLAMDARERTTMVQCYLALTEEGEVDDSNLTIVLQALFRPTQDGIVKDDASSDLSPGGLLSRALNSR